MVANVWITTIDLFSWYVLFYLCRSCDNTLENCFFQISFYSRAYLRIIYEKTKGPVPLGPLLGKQNIQAEEVYRGFKRGRWRRQRDRQKVIDLYGQNNNFASASRFFAHFFNLFTDPLFSPQSPSSARDKI